MIRVYIKVYVLVDKCMFFLFFLCYFSITAVLRSFKYVSKFSFEIKLDGTYYEFTGLSAFTCSKLTTETLEQSVKIVTRTTLLALRSCHIIFSILDLSELIFIDSTSNLGKHNLLFITFPYLICWSLTIV